jgi:hypothetical protein
LCTRLKKQILNLLRTIQLQPYLWRFITANVQPEMINITEDILAKQFQQSLSWQQFYPRSFRMIDDTECVPAITTISTKALSWF